jgi:carbonic anhydrase/acetyltransferase-like protein (isoleucine patch superfamily)
MTLRAFEGHQPALATGAYVDEAAVVIGRVEIGEDASVWPGAVLRGDIHSIRVGARSNLQDNCVLHVTHDSRFNPGGHPLEIGREVTVGHGALLHGCVVEDRCLIGMGAVVMDGARIGSETILGAGSLVPPGKVLEGGYLWVGRPAKRVRPLDERERAYLLYAAGHYVAVKDRYLRQSSGVSGGAHRTAP